MRLLHGCGRLCISGACVWVTTDNDEVAVRYEYVCTLWYYIMLRDAMRNFRCIFTFLINGETIFAFPLWSKLRCAWTSSVGGLFLDYCSDVTTRRKSPSLAGQTVNFGGASFADESVK